MLYCAKKAGTSSMGGGKKGITDEAGEGNRKSRKPFGLFANGQTAIARKWSRMG
jgi:hypothetical protein